MNGYAEKHLDDGAFGEAADNFGALRTFDAFPKTKATYTRRTSGGGYATVFLAACSALLCLSEFKLWWAGSETQQFSVEKGIGHALQINLDAVIHMPCADLHVNVQDAAGDRIFAGDMLQRDPTNWDMWMDGHLMHLLGQERNKQMGPAPASAAEDAVDAQARRLQREQADTHAGHVLSEVRRGKRKFPKTPRTRRGAVEDSCRIYGSLEGNKVQGDFHITARGHGYQEFGEHLAHDTFNFSHVINELSFGPLYPSLLNPLDSTLAATEDHFYRFQYYLSLVPTVYTTSRDAPRAIPAAPASSRGGGNYATGGTEYQLSRHAVRTNQYAVTAQFAAVPENQVPGVFFKFDIEPILLTIVAARGGLLSLIVRIVNVASGVLVGGGWIYQLWGWGRDVGGWRRRRGGTVGSAGGMLHGRKEDSDAGEED